MSGAAVRREVPDRETCFICAQPATTAEHVIPRWLQHRFDLWNERLELPNGTTIPYSQLTIPACARCNNEIYGVLEDRVSRNAASPSDLWKWANKIHYGLAFKDRFLEWDRRNPGYKIGDIVRIDDPLEKDRHFLHCLSGDFATTPDPFGSVFSFKFKQTENFDLAHMLPSSSLCMSLGDWGLIVFVTDGQALQREVNIGSIYSGWAGGCRREDMLFFYAQCVEHLTRHELGQNILMTPRSIVRIGATAVHNVTPVNKERFRAICDRLGLHWIDSNPDS